MSHRPIGFFLGGWDPRHGSLTATAAPAPAPSTGIPLFVLNFIHHTDAMRDEAAELVSFVEARGGADISAPAFTGRYGEFLDLGALFNVLSGVGRPFNIVVIAHSGGGPHAGLARTSAGLAEMPTKYVMDVVSEVACSFGVPCGFYAICCYSSVGESSIVAPYVDYRSHAFENEHNKSALVILRDLHGVLGWAKNEAVANAILAKHGLA